MLSEMLSFDLGIIYLERLVAFKSKIFFVNDCSFLCYKMETPFQTNDIGTFGFRLSLNRLYLSRDACVCLK